MLQPTLILPTKDEVKKMISEGQPLNSNSTLVAGSRTFAGPISQLPEIMARAVREMYAFLRGLDEAEDGDINPYYKKLGLHKIAFLGSELTNPELTKTGLESLISGELPEVTQILLSGADPSKVPFINSFGTGLVLRDAYRLPLEVRKIIGNSIVHMSTGMMRALGDGGIKTEEDLKKYIYYVAGLVGGSTAQLFNLLYRSPPTTKKRLDEELAIGLGEFLQLTNITSNVRADFNARTASERSRLVFIPEEYIRAEGVTIEDLFNTDDLNYSLARANILNRLWNLAQPERDKGLKYLKSITEKDEDSARYKLFCTLPFVFAVRNWELMLRSGADKVFEGKRINTNINEEDVKSLTNYFTEKAMRPDDYLDRMLESFTRNPNLYDIPQKIEP